MPGQRTAEIARDGWTATARELGIQTGKFILITVHPS